MPCSSFGDAGRRCYKFAGVPNRKRRGCAQAFELMVAQNCRGASVRFSCSFKRMYCAMPVPIIEKAGINIQNHQPLPIAENESAIATKRNAMPMKTFLNACSRRGSLLCLLISPPNVIWLFSRLRQLTAKRVRDQANVGSA